jgi:hypothetical protein
MINKRFLLIITFIQVICSMTYAQNLNYTSKFQFLGYDHSDPVFKIYEADANSKGLYKIKPGNSGLYGFYVYQTIEFLTKEIEFMHDDIFLRRFKRNGRFQNILYYANDSLEIKNWSIQHCVYAGDYKKLIIFLSNEYDYLSMEIDLSHPEAKIRYIPIKADRAYISKDWFYFSFFHENYDYSPYPHDIFRVKINDWHNPELIFEGSEYDEWFLYPESHIIGTDIALDILDREQSRESEILYNVEAKSYAIVPNMSQNIIWFKGEYYFYFNRTDNTRGIRTIGLEPVPELPTEYPYKKDDVLPREVWYNMPLKEKTFEGTFITPYLLRKANKSELSSLDKSQLRLLRNAIYAQYGYVYNSSDLQDFYGQFEWYRMITAKKEDNDDVILLPDDTKRAELIRKIEESK